MCHSETYDWLLRTSLNKMRISMKKRVTHSGSPAHTHDIRIRRRMMDWYDASSDWWSQRRFSCQHHQREARAINRSIEWSDLITLSRCCYSSSLAHREIFHNFNSSKSCDPHRQLIRLIDESQFNCQTLNLPNFRPSLQESDSEITEIEVTSSRSRRGRTRKAILKQSCDRSSNRGPRTVG